MLLSSIAPPDSGASELLLELSGQPLERLVGCFILLPAFWLFSLYLLALIVGIVRHAKALRAQAVQDQRRG